MAEPTLEQLYENLEKLGKTASKMETFMAMHDKDNDKDAAIKKAEDEEKEKEKMEAKKAAYDAAIKLAMDEDDHDKKHAAIRKANDDYDDKKHDAMHDDKEHKAMDEKEKEHEAHVAHIVKKDIDLIRHQILTANKIFNPQGLEQVEARLKAASIVDLNKEYEIVKPFIAGVEPAQFKQQTQEKIIPFFANIQPSDVDKDTLTASSPDSEFSKYTTQELMEMGR